MKYPAADKALKVSETRASEKLCSAEASASKYPGARKPHSESGEFRCRKAVRDPILQGRENSLSSTTAYFLGYQAGILGHSMTEQFT